MVLLLSVATGSPSFSQQSQKYDAVVDEHRFTSLETEVREISDAVKEMKKEQEESYPMDVIKTLAMSGLIGEAGIRLIRNRKREE